jgi:hypothetical protein
MRKENGTSVGRAPHLGTPQRRRELGSALHHLRSVTAHSFTLFVWIQYG